MSLLNKYLKVVGVCSVTGAMYNATRLFISEYEKSTQILSSPEYTIQLYLKTMFNGALFGVSALHIIPLVAMCHIVEKITKNKN